jgi:hypothetical protein
MTNVKLHKPASRPIKGTNTHPGHLDAQARQKLGRELRGMYTAFQELPLPDRLAHLLDELRTRTADKK